MDTKTNDTNREQRIAELKSYDFVVGKRDPRLNRSFKGAFMVAEEYGDWETPTDDGRCPFCVVGDDLDKLIDEGWEYMQFLKEAG